MISTFDNLSFAPFNISVLHHFPSPHTNYVLTHKLLPNKLECLFLLTSHTRYVKDGTGDVPPYLDRQALLQQLTNLFVFQTVQLQRNA